MTTYLIIYFIIGVLYTAIGIKNELSMLSVYSYLYPKSTLIFSLALTCILCTLFWPIALFFDLSGDE